MSMYELTEYTHLNSINITLCPYLQENTAKRLAEKHTLQADDVRSNLIIIKLSII